MNYLGMNSEVSNKRNPYHFVTSPLLGEIKKTDTSTAPLTDRVELRNSEGSLSTITPDLSPRNSFE